MKEPNEAQRKAMTRVAKALAEVPVDKKRERDALHARLRQKYAELEPLKSGMSKEDLDRFEEIGEIIELLEKSEGSGRRQKRS
jgi:hypothetical protein